MNRLVVLLFWGFSTAALAKPALKAKKDKTKTTGQPIYLFSPDAGVAEIKVVVSRPIPVKVTDTPVFLITEKASPTTPTPGDDSPDPDADALDKALDKATPTP